MDKAGVAAFLSVVLLAGCAATPEPQSEATASAPSAAAPMSAVDVASEPRYPIELDWSIDTTDPRAIEEFSSLVVKGVITSVGNAFVNSAGMINTIYTVDVSDVYRGQLASRTIEVSLPGGAMPRGEYIAALDELGLYNMLYGPKSEEFMREKGIDPDSVVDPREQDPLGLIIHNVNSNPTSPSFLKAANPEAFIFFLNSDDGPDRIFGSVLNHSVKYVREGIVYSFTEDQESTRPFSEGQLRDE